MKKYLSLFTILIIASSCVTPIEREYTTQSNNVEFTYECSEWTNNIGNNFQGESIKGFKQIYKVNTDTKDITHISSVVEDFRELIIEEQEKEVVIFWEYPIKVFTYTRPKYYFNNPNTLLFNFEEGTLLQMSHTGIGSLRDQISFDCVKR